MLTVDGRDAWRLWLEEHHASETEVWLVFFKGERSVLGYDAAVEEALCYGWVDGLIKRVDDERCMRRFTPRKAGSAWSDANRRRVRALVAAGRMTPAGYAVMRPEVLTEDAPPRTEAVDFPPPHDAMLTPAARQGFERLTPAQRRNYVRWVTEAKREETRVARMTKACAMLERGEKLEM
jgi:uncharacterized protein YdeI (YjbR/CyaY-like superfamily)